jgi:hypothetical protein
MFEPDFTPMPVYGAVKTYTPTARFVDIGFKSTTHWAMEWRGTWKSVGDDRAYFGEYKTGRQGDKETGSGGAGESGRLGDSVSFSWRGTDLDLVVMQNPYGGAVRVQIDSDTPREIELWRTDSGAGGRISLARDLDNGEHRVSLTVTHAPVAINGFIVQSGNNWLVKRVVLVGLLVSLLVVGYLFWTRMSADKRR